MQKPEVPFFVRLLETQETETKELQVKSDVKAGRFGPPPPGDVTMKYPSDDDENPTS